MIQGARKKIQAKTALGADVLSSTYSPIDNMNLMGF
jgi:hypothetical protein